MKLASPFRFSRSKGVVLPIVLIILVILTALVVTQVRRTTVDQRMAANAQESVALDTAAKAVLSWCEADIQRANRGNGTNMPRSMPAPPDNTATAAWLVQANWTNSSYTPTSGTPLANVAAATCLIEDATDELEGDIGGIRECRWKKYRTTAQVLAPAPDLPARAVPFVPAGFRAYFAQGEMRLYSNLVCG